MGGGFNPPPWMLGGPRQGPKQCAAGESSGAARQEVPPNVFALFFKHVVYAYVSCNICCMVYVYMQMFTCCLMLGEYFFQ